jgi:putative PEP-CTERM system histidine kinase
MAVAASTSLSADRRGALSPQGTEGAQVIRALREHPEPVDIDSSKETWAAVLRRCQPGEFRKGGNRVCVPMLAGGNLLGLMTLGDRVGGIPFSLQDFDLLKCVAEQAAAGLLNIQLAQRLMQAKELEAFQTMSAFFVHDLKNTASTLSLMLKNLPIHFDNPAFREDALRAVSKTVAHINGLISRLSLLRENLAMKPASTNLNELVAAALKPFEGTPGVTLEKSLEPIPVLSLDREQISNVVTNLLLNAKEALGQQGAIRVATRQQAVWAVVSVTDNGCGMSPEFISRSLFRPFQTTKKEGIGVGMFQCKMIVEAHRGKIEVQSEPGRGTTFHVKLPLQHEEK